MGHELSRPGVIFTGDDTIMQNLCGVSSGGPTACSNAFTIVCVVEVGTSAGAHGNYGTLHQNVFFDIDSQGANHLWIGLEYTTQAIVADLSGTAFGFTEANGASGNAGRSHPGQLRL